MRFAWISIGFASVVLVHSATAQATDTVLGTRLLANPMLRAPFHDTLRLDLSKHGQYRIAIWPGGTVLHVVVAAHPDRRVFAPLIRQGSGSQPTIVELYPQDDGAHLLTLEPPTGISVVRIWVWEDSTAEAAAHERVERRWGIGVTVGGGALSGYSFGQADPGAASSYGEAGILVASRSSTALVLGAGRDSRPTVDTAANYWIFFEARQRLAHFDIAGRELDAIAALRGALGAPTSATTDPGVLAIGVIANWHLDHRRGFRGLTVGAEILYGQLYLPNDGFQAITRGGLLLTWFP